MCQKRHVGGSSVKTSTLTKTPSFHYSPNRYLLDKSPFNGYSTKKKRERERERERERSVLDKPPSVV